MSTPKLYCRPQNTPADIAGLCKATDITRLLYHQSMQAAASKAQTASNGALKITPTLVHDAFPSELPRDFGNARSSLSPEEESETDCIIFHSSGSSGTPKVCRTAAAARGCCVGAKERRLTLRFYFASRYLRSIASGLKRPAANPLLRRSQQLHYFTVA